MTSELANLVTTIRPVDPTATGEAERAVLTVLGIAVGVDASDSDVVEVLGALGLLDTARALQARNRPQIAVDASETPIRAMTRADAGRPRETNTGPRRVSRRGAP